MKRLAVILFVMAMFSAPAGGDRVVLKDGRIFEGTVTELEGKILIELDFGKISISASEIESIERGPTPADRFESRLIEIDRTDADALFELSEWAKENGLLRRSEKILREVVSINSDHSGARRLLKHVKSDGKWLELPAAIELARSKLEAGKHETLLKQLLPEIEKLLDNPKHKRLIRNLEAHCLLRAKQFDRARRRFEELAEKSPAAESVRYGIIAEILKIHPNGMYVLTEPYPPTAMLLASPGKVLKPGPASLARPAVLSAALRDSAKVAVKKGQSLMAEGKTIESIEPEAAKTKYVLAGKCFDKADAIVPLIARSWRVEIARRRIAMITKDRDVQAAKYDALKDELGKRDMSASEYADLVGHMLKALTRVRSDLEAILELAGPYERELVLEITDATLRLHQSVKPQHEILKRKLRELNGK